MKEWKCILLYSQRGVDPLDSTGKKEIDTINIIIIIFIGCVFLSPFGTIQ